jgi:hypothetical protein
VRPRSHIDRLAPPQQTRPGRHDPSSTRVRRATISGDAHAHAQPIRGSPSPDGDRTRKTASTRMRERPALALDESIRAARPLLSRRLHRQSVGVLTSRAAFPRTGLRLRNRLKATTRPRSGVSRLSCGSTSSSPDGALGRSIPCAPVGAAIIESRFPAAVGAAGGEQQRRCGGTGFGSRPSLRRDTEAAESRDTEATEERTSVKGRPRPHPTPDVAGKGPAQCRPLSHVWSKDGSVDRGCLQHDEELWCG